MPSPSIRPTAARSRPPAGSAPAPLNGRARAAGPAAPGKTPPRRSRAKPRLAALADRHDLYQRAVQCPEAEIDFVDATFRELRGRHAVRLREDFCGTANTSCEWVRRRSTNIAVGLDLDAPTLEWGRAHNLSRLRPAQRDRIDLRISNVLDEHPDLKGTLDCVLAMNFSFWIFQDRPTMLAYFRRVREDLRPDGVLFTDFYGGFEAHQVLKERRRIPRATRGEPSVHGFNHPFTYVWDQRAYNPIDGSLTCAIHFEFADGSRLRDAYVYRWRLWNLREVRDVLHEAGFRRTTVYWEGDDGRGGGNGEFTASERGEACASWVCYVTAEK